MHNEELRRFANETLSSENGHQAEGPYDEGCSTEDAAEVGLKMLNRLCQQSVKARFGNETADIIVVVGPVNSALYRKIGDCCEVPDRAQNAIVWLSTFGGVPDDAFRIGKLLRRVYPDGKVVGFISNFCKSAGTLITIAFDSLIMADKAELGPLDVQLQKREEVGERESGLTVLQSLDFLNNKATDIFFETYARIRNEGLISSRLAMHIATEFTCMISKPLLEQIDPIRIGENLRDINVANLYGMRLNRGNLKPDALGYLIQGYPSHGFVIDREEAEDLFERVFRPTPEEEILIRILEQKMLDTLHKGMVGGGSIKDAYLVNRIYPIPEGEKDENVKADAQPGVSAHSDEAVAQN